MNKIFKHPANEQMQVELILASKATADHPPIYTVRMRYPRIIHGEIMTHRMFSRNARSSRAVPVKTMLNEVRDIPFVPWHWGKNQKGMQADEECNEIVWNQLVQMPLAGSGYGHPLDWKGKEIETTGVDRDDAWLMAAKRAFQSAEAFMNAGYHKQIPNRLLEPFSWIDTLITSTHWSNFLWLRDHEDAEPHLQDLARLVKQAIDEAEFQELAPGEWHLPYITADDLKEANFGPSQTPANNWLCQISAARCARISYKPFDGDASYERELDRYNMLVTADRVHASPLEHQATPDSFNRLVCEYAGEIDYSDPETTWRNPHLHGNLPGWIQYRKTVDGEVYRTPTGI